MRVPSVQDVFAIGDCSGYLETTGKPTLPALAQVDKLKYFFSLLSLFSKKLDYVLWYWLHTFLICYWSIKVAEREGKYLANLLNAIGKANGGRANSAKEIELGVPFVYKHLGSMATIGRYKALVDLRESKVTKFDSIFLWYFIHKHVFEGDYLSRTQKGYQWLVSWAGSYGDRRTWLES